MSYVRSHGTRDLNDYDQFFGNFRNPIIRPNENSLSPTDVPNRLIVRGTIGLPGQVGLRRRSMSGARASRGRRSTSSRTSSARATDPAGSPPCRPWISRSPGPGTSGSIASRAGIKIYNAFDTGNERDVQNNITSPDYGTFYNPIQRSIGFVFGTTKP